MPTENVHTLILGAGASGLAAGYLLAKAGLKPVVIEKDKVAGGLMRSIRHGDFVVDVGRKELYNRLAKVDSFWSEILGKDYRLYPHRGGILYDGHIIDRSRSFQGFRRGMPWSMFLGCCWDFLSAQVNPSTSRPHNLEEYWHQKRGRRLTEIVSQGFQEKLYGTKWADVKLDDNHVAGNGASFLPTIKEALVRTFSEKDVNTDQGIWKHPAKGSGQICESLERGMVGAGGRIQYNARLVEIASAQGVVDTVSAEIASETVVYKPLNVVSSLPLEFLIQLLSPRRLETGAVKGKPSFFRRKTVVLVYLFLDEEPRFPHAWLEVTCPKTRIGRITNYTGFSGDMVPKGKTCLCCEFYCFGEDPLLELDNKQFAELALEDCSKFKLVDRTKCFDNLVLRFPGADASQNRDNWMSKTRLGLLEELKPLKNLYYVNRSDTDIATLAGIEAAEAILSGDRSEFDRHIDPTQLKINSESKAFEFKNPAGVGA